MAIVSMKALLETGVHFGHRTRRWNPKMKPFIFTERNGIHIIDLQQTLVLLEEAYELVRSTVADGGTILFVGTKRQAQDTVAKEAARGRQPYVNSRWLGGTLTNWTTIRQRIEYLEKLESRRDAGEFDLLKKTERLRIEKEIEKLNERLGGIRTMKSLPELLFIVDVSHEETAVREANKLGIPIIGVVDTNCNPDPIDYVIPSNDDAIRAIKLLVGKMADAALEGLAVRQEDSPEEIVDFDGYQGADFDGMGNVSDEELLGGSTLAKLRDAEENAAEAVVEAEVAVVEAEIAEEIAEEAIVEAIVAEEIAEEAIAAEEISEEAVVEAIVAEEIAEEVAAVAEVEAEVAEEVTAEAVVEAIEAVEEAVEAEEDAAE